MTGVREEKKRAARARLYAEALRLIETKGYDGVTAAEIAAAAGLAKGTMFNHFPSKAHILADWYAERTALALHPVRGRAGEALEAQLLGLVTSAIEACMAHPEMWRAKRREAQSCEAIQRVEAETDAAVRARAEMLAARAREEGRLAARVEPAAFADLYLAIVSGTMSEGASTGAADPRPLLEQRIGALCALAAD